MIGGGLAGIAAAVRLSDQGLAVTLVETRKRLGGRATSFVDPSNGQLLDNCQHVLMGCCTNLIDLYERLGVADRIKWHRRLHFLDGEGRLDVLEANDLPAPLHMATALFRFRSLSLPQKLAIARGMLAIMRTGETDLKRWHDRSFAEWLEARHQPRAVIDKFWSVIIISATNELPDRVAADYALQVFREGFLANERAYVVGIPGVPLVQLYDAAEQVIRAAGGKVLLATSAEHLDFDGARVRALRVDGDRRIEAEAFVSALPFDRLAKICGAANTRGRGGSAMCGADERLQYLDRFQVSPIIGVHLWLDRPVLELPHLILTESPLQWIFNKGTDPQPIGSAASPDPLTATPDPRSPRHQHLHGVISAAHDLVDQPPESIADMTVREVRRAIPAAVEARVLHHRVVKEKRATFSACPGIDRFRPPPCGSIPNLFLAGDWCRSGWPATMEGAVRSGYLAAAALLEGCQIAVKSLVPELKAEGLYRLLGR